MCLPKSKSSIPLLQTVLQTFVTIASHLEADQSGTIRATAAVQTLPSIMNLFILLDIMLSDLLSQVGIVWSVVLPCIWLIPTKTTLQQEGHCSKSNACIVALEQARHRRKT